MTLSLRINTGSERVFESVTRTVSDTGCTADAIAAPLKGVRFAWIELRAEDGGRVKALAELVDRDGAELRFRFKHLFPGERAKLAGLLEHQEDVSRAA